jgi:hypothetical protein
MSVHFGWGSGESRRTYDLRGCYFDSFKRDGADEHIANVLTEQTTSNSAMRVFERSREKDGTCDFQYYVLKIQI